MLEKVSNFISLIFTCKEGSCVTASLQALHQQRQQKKRQTHRQKKDIDTGSSPTRFSCFTSQRKENIFKTKIWFSIQVNLKVSKIKAWRSHRL
jgi:hypothetical protein